MNKGDILDILFVCTGNSCRSVMAEGLLKKMAKEMKKNNVRVNSAGVATMNGIPPTENTITVMKKEGVDVSNYRSPKLTKEMITRSDLIIAMHKFHRDRIIELAPPAEPKTHLLKDFTRLDDGTREPNVADPIGCPLEVYERVLEVIKKHLEELVKKI